MNTVHEVCQSASALPLEEQIVLVQSLTDSMPVETRADLVQRLIRTNALQVTFGGHSFNAQGHVFYLNALEPEAIAQVLESIAVLIKGGQEAP